MSQEVDRRLLLSAAGLAGVAVLARSAGAGPLNPPAGPVASTAKPIGEIEPRTAINSTNTPGDASATFRISASGSYYLAGNINGQAGRAMIAVSTSDVTIDLNGFVLNGLTVATAGVTAGTNARVRVHNGFIRSVAGPAVALSSLSRAEDLTVTSCADGIVVSDHGAVRRCVLSTIGGTSTASPASISGGDLAVIEDCQVVNPVANAGVGNAIRVETVGRISRCSISASNSGVPAVFILTNFTSVVEQCVVRVGVSVTADLIQVAGGGCRVLGNHLSCSTAGTVTGVRSSGSVMVADNDFNNIDQGVELGTSSNCTVVRNRFINGTSAVAGSALATCHIGPVLLPAGVAASSNPHANYWV